MSRLLVRWGRQCLVMAAACFVLAVALSACGEDTDAATHERLLALEAKAHSMEESLEAAAAENAALKAELALLRQEQGGYLQTRESAEAGQETRLASLEEEQDGLAQADDLDALETRLEGLETSAADGIEEVYRTVDRVFTGLDARLFWLEDTGYGKTMRLVESGGGKAQIINYGQAYGARASVLVLPDPLPEGEIPLIVSLHGFGGDSFSHSQYFPLHDLVNRDGFALLLPEGVKDLKGNSFWNPTDGCCDKNGSPVDDVSALTALVQEASGEFDMGPLYFFGYSNGGFMAYHMACKGLPGLRAVASLAGTSYYEDSNCEDAPPVSVLHVHGEKDEVIRFHGSEAKLSYPAPIERYVGAKDMYWRWGERAGCHSEKDSEERLDLDANMEGPETFVHRFTEGCADGITVEMWTSDGGGHAPGYGYAFTDALLAWLLAQK